MKNKLENLMGWIFIISSILFFIVVFAFIVKDFLGKDFLIAFIGFFGSIIGGSLTLIGVKWTLQSQERKDKQKRYEKANYVFTELLPKLIAVYNSIKSLNPFNWSDTIDRIVENAKELEEMALEMSSEAKDIGIEFYREVKNVQYYSGVLYDYIENVDAGIPDQKISDNLFVYYQGLAEADNELLKIVNEIKHS